jgi:hypothetical protein
MANYANVNLTTGPISGNGEAGSIKAAFFEVYCSAALTTSDTLQFGYLPANARIVDSILESDDLDTNASPTLTLNVGDAGSASRLFAASTVGQAGTAGFASAVTGIFYKTTAKTLITGAPAANAATGAAGSIRLCILYTVD